jgi:hypothetical protein
MRKIILLCASLFAAAVSFSANPAMAQQWVGPNGSDANNCTQTAPCATFQGALNKFPGQVLQINCLASGSYGSFTITASITIDCGAGNVGNIVVGSSQGQAIKINASSEADIVLRHLSMNGLASAEVGIAITAFPSGSLTLEDCTVQRFTNDGVGFGTTAGRGLLSLSNTRILNSNIGILVAPSNGEIDTVTLDRVALIGNTTIGLILTDIGSGIIAGTMRDSIVSASPTGVGASATQVFFTIEESSIVANTTNGIQTFTAGSNINATGSTISGNGTGVVATAGNIISFGNNTLNGNAADGSFTSTKALKWTGIAANRLTRRVQSAGQL